jgi:hypothetical protein
MPATARPLAVATLVAAVLAAAGCGGNSGTPNPDLKAPDVPPGDRGSSGGAAKDPKAKK